MAWWERPLPCETHCTRCRSSLPVRTEPFACFHGRSQRFLDRCRGMAPKPCGAGTGASLPRRTRRHRSRTLTAPHAAPSIGAMSTYPVRTRRWTRKEYDRLISLAILRESEPIELIGGQLFVLEPTSSLLVTVILTITDARRRASGGGGLV